MDNEIKQVLDLILNKLSSLEKGQANLEKGQKDLERRQDEAFQVVKAIKHSNTTRKAELDNLTHKVAYVEGTLNGVGEFLQNRKAQYIYIYIYGI